MTLDVRAPAAPAAEDEFEALYAAHFPRLAGYCLSLVGNPTAASDIAQEAFARLYGRWTSVRDPQGWLYFVATNLTHDHWRGRQRDTGLVDAIGVVEQRRGPDPAYDPWLRDLVERLPERLSKPLLLHYYADLPVEEVARLLHRPVGTIKRRLHEARALLGAQIGTDRG
ncbi:MAG TPA: RNA polymerase sigma factor [Mycobacteriales bacterium]|nr:RNA polymerase sigma factor [Mycobacteriales bacterium]